jgi:glycosyltransferase involved in cell wall biosynthesis
MGLFIKRHAEVAAVFANVALLYLRAAPDKPIGYKVDHKVENEVATTIVYYGTKSILPSFIIKRITGFLFAVAFIKGYRFLLDSWGKPDIIHVNVLTRLGVFALCLRKFHGIKYVITEHWSRYLPITGTYKGWLRKYLTKVVVRNASAVSTVSVNLAKSMQNHGLIQKNFMILPNVVDTEDYISVLTESKNKNKRFIHISCFEDRSKNISGLLRSISKLAKLREDFECIMVGEGIDLEKMKTLSAKLGLNESQVRFTGLLEGAKVVEAYQSADFMVMFSNYENMPVVISESLSCGLPVIATAVGGIPEYINEANGLLVNANDEVALFDALNFMLDHFSDFDKQKIRQNAVGIFGKQAVSQKLKELYNFVK